MFARLPIGTALIAGLLAVAVALPAGAQSKARPRSQPSGSQPAARPPSQGQQPRAAQPQAGGGARHQPRAVPRTGPIRPWDRGNYRPPYGRTVYYSPYYYYPWGGWDWGWGGGWGRSYGFGWGYGYGYDQYGPYAPYPYYARRGLAGSLRVQFQPNTAEVYVDGSFAGIVDEFDGFFQNLPVEPGGREITVYHEGFRSFSERIYVQPYRTFKLKGTLVPLAAGEPSEPRPVSNAMSMMGGSADPAMAHPYDPAMAPPPGWRGVGQPPPPAEEPAMRDPSNFGQVAIRVQPPDAEVLIDDEPWRGPQGADRLVVFLKPGLHRIDIRKEGFDAFVTTVDVKKGETTVLNVSLGRVSGV